MLKAYFDNSTKNVTLKLEGGPTMTVKCDELIAALRDSGDGMNSPESSQAMDSAFLARFPDASRLQPGQVTRAKPAALATPVSATRFPHVDRLFKGQ